MEKSTKHNKQHNFLKEGLKSDISKHHKKYLGTDIPDNYFATSKISILDKIKEESKKEVLRKPKKQLVFWLQPKFRYMAAASLVCILSLTVWLQNANNTDDFKTNDLELLAFSDDVLINSLLVEDSELEMFAETTLINEVVIKAEISEQKLDDLILNSLISEGSLTDDYMNYRLVETIIL